jgi:hypothetical protein
MGEQCKAVLPGRGYQRCARRSVPGNDGRCRQHAVRGCAVPSNGFKDGVAQPPYHYLPPYRHRLML